MKKLSSWLMVLMMAFALAVSTVPTESAYAAPHAVGGKAGRPKAGKGKKKRKGNKGKIRKKGRKGKKGRRK